MGNVVGLPVSGLLSEHGFSEGWDSVFYVIGKRLYLTVLTAITEMYSHKMPYSIRQNRIQKTRLEIQVMNLHEPTY